jgi:hypothetical protein
MMVGKKKKPEHICHIELTSGETAFNSPDAKQCFVKKGKTIKTKRNK